MNKARNGWRESWEKKKQPRQKSSQVLVWFQEEGPPLSLSHANKIL